MIEFTADQQDALAKLKRLRAANRKALEEIKSKEGTAAGKMVIGITQAFAERWEATAPRLTGTLASSTREQFRNGRGQVFIDQGTTNPVFGGKPAEYGPIVHRRQPWVAQLMRDARRIVQAEAEVFVESIGDVYE